jgi:hypothetical protein
MSEKELREHMDDLWDALYVRLRASCPERAAQVRHHDSNTAVASTAAAAAAAACCLHHAVLMLGNCRLPQACCVAFRSKSFRFTFYIFLDVVCSTCVQDIILDTKTELNMACVQRWLKTVGVSAPDLVGEAKPPIIRDID